MNHPPTILLTIDVEDWFMVENLRPWFPPATWDNQEQRIEQNTHKVLDILDSIELREPKQPSYLNKPINPKATFFVLGWIAQRQPSLVREIKNRGHEVASHGFNHLMCDQMNTGELQQDLVRSKKILEDTIGFEVKGYRAPNFSISDATLKSIQISGYKYDSSYNNFSRHGRYGTLSINGENNSSTAIDLGNDFTELKISNLTVANQIIPWGGGGYFRLFPPLIFNAGVKRSLKKNQTYLFYLHPWELDPQQPRLKSKRSATWRHYLNLDKTQNRLCNLITTFNRCKFSTCSQYIQDIKKLTLRTQATQQTQQTQRTQRVQ